MPVNPVATTPAPAPTNAPMPTAAQNRPTPLGVTKDGIARPPRRHEEPRRVDALRVERVEPCEKRRGEHGQEEHREGVQDQEDDLPF